MLKQEWKQGQHLAIAGPTGAGKTYLASDLLEIRRYVVAISTKKKDDTLERYSKYAKVRKWRLYTHKTRILFCPTLRQLADIARQRVEIYCALNDMFLAGGYTIYFDDLFYVSSTLKLKEPVQMLYTQSRSNNVTLVSSIQRPVWIPSEVLSQSTWLIMLKHHDMRDVETIAEATGMDRKNMKALNSSLQGHDFLLIKNGRSVTYVKREE